MRLISILAAGLGLLALAAPAHAQDSPEHRAVSGSGMLPAAVPTKPVKLDVPMPPRGAFDQAPPKHGMPAVPVATGGKELPPGQATVVGQQGAGPNAVTVKVYRNSQVTPLFSSRSNVGEPSAARLLGGRYVLQTGNWYAARSSNSGASWSYVNPYTRFSKIDGGFCCDQVAINHQRQGMTLWLLQYSYSKTTRKNSIRIAVGVGDSRTGNPNHYYTLNPQNVGFPAYTWFDFPHIAVTSGFVFVASNVFNSASKYVGSVVIRLDAAKMKAGASAPFRYSRSDSKAPSSRRFSSARFALGYYAPTTMYWATHVNTKTIRIFTWADSSAGYSYRDRTISTWYGGRTPSPGPDKRDWLGRTDSRIQGGFQTSSEIGWMWTSNRGGSYQRMHTRIVKFDRSYNKTWEKAIWNNSYAWAYASVSPSSVGAIAGSIMVGGSNLYPGTVGWIIDDLNCNGFDNAWVAQGNSGPTSGRGGDYLWSQYINGNKWMVTGMAQRGGASNSQNIPRNADIGRVSTAFPRQYSLYVNSSPVAGASYSCSRGDMGCRQSGFTNTRMSYRSGTSVTVTAAATLGSRKFYRWYYGSSPQPVGRRYITVSMTATRRIRAQYGRYRTPAFVSSGVGCRTSGGIAKISGTSLPEIGKKAVYLLTGAPKISPAILTLGFSSTLWGPIRLPFLLPGTPSCYLRTPPTITWSMATNNAGSASFALPLPNDIRLLGARYYNQYLPLEIRPTLALRASNLLQSTVGGWDFR